MAAIEIPWTRLSEDALRGVVEEFVTREGTDYGANELSLEEKVDRVLRHLRAGEVVILFESEQDRCHLVTRQALAGANT